MEENKKALIHPKKCPLCGIETSYLYRVTESEINLETDWYRCQCGIIFQPKFPGVEKYSEEGYNNTYVNMKEGDKRLVHAARTYANLLEELTYGRMMLDVGFAAPDNMAYFAERGWLTWGIDINPNVLKLPNVYTGNFETADFTLKDKEGKVLTYEDNSGGVKREFDLIWMAHVLEHFQDPQQALRKAYDLLGETGVIFISTPDIEFINKVGVPNFPHFKGQEHYTLWSEAALKRELERAGFKVILSRRNFSSRYQSWWDIHCIAQKNYF